MKKIKFIYVIGVEGCGHHGFYPMLTTSIAAYEKARCEKHLAPPMLGRWGALRRLFNKLWYDATPLAPTERRRVLLELDLLMKRVASLADASPAPAYIVEDNSFPSSVYRSTSRQWDLLELREIMAPYVATYFIALYRNPSAATFSHPEFDGDLRGHARVIAEFLEYLNGKLELLGRECYRVVHYEDLMRRDQAMVATLSDYLDVPPVYFQAGFDQLRASKKDWRIQLPSEDREWLINFFDDQRLSRWPNFLPFSAGLCQD